MIRVFAHCGLQDGSPEMESMLQGALKMWEPRRWGETLKIWVGSLEDGGALKIKEESLVSGGRAVEEGRRIYRHGAFSSLLLLLQE